MLKDAKLSHLSQTGGLPFFGGAGNNYALHAIVEMVNTLRNKKEDLGLVQANGGFLSKQSVGVYSTKLPEHNLFERVVDLQSELSSHLKSSLVSKFDGSATLISYCLNYKRGTMSDAIVLGKTHDGFRFIAKYDGELSQLSSLKKGRTLDVKSTALGNVVCVAT